MENGLKAEEKNKALRKAMEEQYDNHLAVVLGKMHDLGTVDEIQDAWMDEGISRAKKAMKDRGDDR